MLKLAHRMALVTAAATLLLIVAGGLVTNTGAGLAVPDWPTTFGQNMFLYPWSRMVGAVFFEHSHRLLGALVGLLTLALAAILWRVGGRYRALGAVAVAAVIAQGVLGGLRVVMVENTLAAIHGCVAQAYFGLLAVIVVMTAPRREAGPRLDASLRTLAILAVAVVYLQIVFGALLTHFSALSLHLVGAVAVFALVPMLTARFRRTGDPDAPHLSACVLALLALQLLLGVGSYVARFTPLVVPHGLALPVTHRLVGSLILAVTVAIAVRIAERTGRAAWQGSHALTPASRLG